MHIFRIRLGLTMLCCCGMAGCLIPKDPQARRWLRLLLPSRVRFVLLVLISLGAAAISLWAYAGFDAFDQWKMRQTNTSMQATVNDRLLQFYREEDAHNGKTQRRRLPGAIIIGMGKCGTRALIEFLEFHPSVKIAHAEVNFFNNDINYAKGFEWYASRMPLSRPDQITIEKTPAYFGTERVPRRIKAMNRTIKLILIVRDPVERAISHYEHKKEELVRKKETIIPFEDLAVVNGSVNEAYWSVKWSIYSHGMALWLQVFPRQQILVLSGDEFAKNPAKGLQQVERFLGLRAFFRYKNFYLDDDKGFYCMRVKTRSGKKENYCLGKDKGRPHTPVPQDVIVKLRRYFQPYNEEFYRLAGIDFGWPTS